MTNQSPVRIVLANRPRLFRELLQHALKSNVAKDDRPFQIIEVTDRVPTAAQLENADWLIVDEETAAAAIKVSAGNSELKVLSVEGRGHSLQLLTASAPIQWQMLSSAPSLAELAGILREGTPALQPEAHA